MDAEKILDVVFAGVKEMITPLAKRIAALETEVRSIRAVTYKGTYQRALSSEYKQGALVTFAGALWIALRDAPAGVPGESDSWQLCVKAAAAR